jgi:hypothetical protein
MNVLKQHLRYFPSMNDGRLEWYLYKIDDQRSTWSRAVFLILHCIDFRLGCSNCQEQCQSK